MRERERERQRETERERERERERHPCKKGMTTLKPILHEYIK